MEDGNLLEKIGQVLRKSRGEPSKFIELITYILKSKREGQIACYPKVVRKLWPEEWQQAEDKVEFEVAKWDLLRRRRREINVTTEIIKEGYISTRSSWDPIRDNRFRRFKLTR